MRIQIVDGEIVLSEVYNGIGIQTDMGLFGVAQRNGGIEVRLNGETVWKCDLNGSNAVAVVPPRPAPPYTLSVPEDDE